MRYFDYSPMYYHSSFWPGGAIALVINVLFWAAIVFLFVFLFRKISGSHAGCCGMHGGHDQLEVEDMPTYLDIIKERYAKGEIDKKQFEELKKDLSE
ncbi:MAG: hypothetical protein V1922_03535 [bacterium]